VLASIRGAHSPLRRALDLTDERGAAIMNVVTSADGTAIAFDELGEGPPLILIVGAFNTRDTTAPLAEALQGHFTVLNYDRRGRGNSTDVQPYSVEREIEDLDALMARARHRCEASSTRTTTNLLSRQERKTNDRSQDRNT
jgi:hypothetical protein